MVDDADEFRNFLLFLPTDTPGLKAVLSYYSSSVTLTAEGDTQFSDETVEGIGTHSSFLPSFISTLFGSIANIASPPKPRPPVSLYDTDASATTLNPLASTCPAMSDASEDVFIEHHSPRNGLAENRPLENNYSKELKEQPSPAHEVLEITKDIVKPMLTILPDPGYFVAGGVAGVISRTATAPLDRLKVYLITQTGVTEASVKAAKSGEPVKAVKQASRPLVNAFRELWKAGGVRSLFAGKLARDQATRYHALIL